MMIEIEQMSFTYEKGTRPALRDVSLRVEAGEFIGIIGESGAGKTTLGHVINGIIPHHYRGDYYGHATVDGLDTFETSLTDLASHIGTVSQDIDNQMVAAIVEDEMLYGLENFGIPGDEIGGRIETALNGVGIPELRHRRISTLSGGQKQKVAIAAIIALEPDIILLDEPTGELDPASSRQIFDLLRELNARGITVIVIEQKVALLCEYVDRLLVMDQGAVALQGTVEDVLKQVDLVEQLGVNCPRVATLCKRLAEHHVGDGRVVSTTDAAYSYVGELIA